MSSGKLSFQLYVAILTCKVLVSGVACKEFLKAICEN